MKGRCIRHGREHGDTPNALRCKEEGCEKLAAVKADARGTPGSMLRKEETLDQVLSSGSIVHSVIL